MNKTYARKEQPHRHVLPSSFLPSFLPSFFSPPELPEDSWPHGHFISDVEGKEGGGSRNFKETGIAGELVLF